MKVKVLLALMIMSVSMLAVVGSKPQAKASSCVDAPYKPVILRGTCTIATFTAVTATTDQLTAAKRPKIKHQQQ
jgi:hypothetical protein